MKKGGVRAKMNMERSEKGMRQEKKNVRMQGKCAKTEKSGNNYGGETHETQLRTPLHLTVTQVLRGYYIAPTSNPT